MTSSLSEELQEQPIPESFSEDKAGIQDHAGPQTPANEGVCFL